MKEALLACCDDFNQLDKGERKEMTRYLLSFYKIIDQREKWTSL